LSYRVPFLSVPILATALVLGACGGGSSDEIASPVPTTPTTPGPPSNPGTFPDTDFANLAACVPNTWILYADQAEKALLGAGVPGVQITTTGVATVSILPDGTYTYIPGFTINMQTPAGPASGQFTGSSKGTWVISGTTLTTTEISNNISGVATGSFGSVPLPIDRSFSSLSANITACNPVYFQYDVSAPSGSFSQRLVSQ
jgi:hypothetical protein